LLENILGMVCSIQHICDVTQTKNTNEPINTIERLLLQQKGRTKRIIADEKKDSKKEAVFQQPPTY
jgi:hypothetical protein